MRFDEYCKQNIFAPLGIAGSFNVAEWEFNGSNGNDYYGLFRSWGLGVHNITGKAGNDVVLPGSTRMFGHPGEAYGLVSDAYITQKARNMA